MRKKDIVPSAKSKKGLTMDSSNSSYHSYSTAGSTLDHLYATKTFLDKLVSLPTEKFLSLLRQQLVSCESFVRHAGTSVLEVTKSALSVSSVRDFTFSFSSGVDQNTRICRLTGDFCLEILCAGHNKGTSFWELNPIQPDPHAWLHHSLFVGECERFLLMSVEDSVGKGPGDFTIRFVQPAEEFLVELFFVCKDRRIEALRNVASMIRLAVERNTARLTASINAQGVTLRTALNHVLL